MAKTKTIENLFINLALYSDLLPIVVFFVFLNKLKRDKITCILVGYLCFDFIINVALQREWIPYAWHNRTYPVFTLIETLLFSWCFFEVLRGVRMKQRVKWFTLFVSIGFLLYYAYRYFLINKKMRIDSIPIGIETILIFIFIGFYFYEQMNDADNLFIYERPHFWGALGIMIYLAGSFFVYVAAEKLPLKEVLKFWAITNIACTIKNLLFALAFYLSAKQLIKKKTPST